MSREREREREREGVGVACPRLKYPNGQTHADCDRPTETPLTPRSGHLRPSDRAPPERVFRENLGRFGRGSNSGSGPKAAHGRRATAAHVGATGAALTELPLLLPLPNRPRFSRKSGSGGARSLGRAEPDSGSGGSRKGVPRALALARRGESMVQRVRGGLGRSWSAPEPRYGHTSTLTRRLDCTGVV